MFETVVEPGVALKLKTSGSKLQGTCSKRPLLSTPEPSAAGPTSNTKVVSLILGCSYGF